VADEIRHLIKNYNQTIPTVLEIPTKDQPYDESKDMIIQRVQKLLGRD
jgi:V-type H+-transporting ATPase subunit F